jgi:large subunit ribosomal protein L37Ae
MARRNQKAKGKVTGSSGRFGCRYGRFIRKRVVEVENVERAAHPCPRCDHASLHRVGTGIWECRKCGFKFAGGAYAPQTPSLRVALRTIERAIETQE